MTSASSSSRLVVALVLLVGVCGFAFALGPPSPVQAISSTIVISQIYGGGGNTGAPLNADFVELFNLGSTTQSLNGWSLQYAAAGAETWSASNRVILPDITLAPGQYFLVQMSQEGENGIALPAPDASGTVSLANDAGKIALVSSDELLSGSGCPFAADVVDFVAYGSTPNCSETEAAPAPSNTNAIARAVSGCTDSDNNQSDFATTSPHPRNTATLLAPCFPPTETSTPTSTDVYTPGETSTVTETPPTASSTHSPPTHLVISQVYSSGGSEGAAYKNDFVELFNPHTSPISIRNLSLQVAPPNEIEWKGRVGLPNMTLDPGQYLLIELFGDGGQGDALPQYDVPGTFALDASGGKIALVEGSAILNESGCPLGPTVVDFVGYGTTANCFEGTAPPPAPSPAEALRRRAGGCTDTNDNARDFDARGAIPRNSQTTPHTCQATATPSQTPIPIPSATATATWPAPEHTNTFTLTVTPTENRDPAPSPTPTPVLAEHIVIGEFRTRGPGGGDDEFIELYNAASVDIVLNDWSLYVSDGFGTPRLLYLFTARALAPGQRFLLVREGAFSGNTQANAFFQFDIADDGGLALKDAQDSIVDAVGFGEFSAYVEGTPLAPMSGTNESSYERRQGGNAGNCVDQNDNASDFLLNDGTSNPQNSNSPPVSCAGQPIATPTYTLTLTATPTLTPTLTPYATGVRINEFMPRPASDWNGDLGVNAEDEWIELYNSNAFPVSLAGWQLDDIAGGGAAPFTFRGDSRIPAHGLVIVYGRETGLTLNDNEPEAVRLLFPDGSTADETQYNGSDKDSTFSRLPDGTGPFTTSCLPTPLAPNCTITPTPTSAAATTTQTTTPTTVPQFEPLAVSISEIAWAGTRANATDEWIELFNNTNMPIALDGWRLVAADNRINILLAGSIPARGYFLLERSDDETISDVPADQIFTGALENDGEVLKLYDPSGREIDSANAGKNGGWYAGSQTARCSMERTDPRVQDMQTNWHTNNDVTRNGHDAENAPVCGTPKNANSMPSNTSTPSPTPVERVTATPTSTTEVVISNTPTMTPVAGGLFVNEFMSDPARDWNLDGVVDDNDEWIEIYNANPFRVNLSGWMLDDVANGGSPAYRIPEGTRIKRHGRLVFYRAVTRLALNNTNDDVRLIRSDGVEADSIAYKSSDPDVSWSRNPDGGSAFTQFCAPTPRTANCTLAPTPTVTSTPYAPDIFINEFLPVPYLDWNGDSLLDSGDEWIEIYNRSQHTVDLSGWLLDDRKGGSGTFRIPDGTLIQGNDLRVFFANETTIGLDNGGDTVRLLHPDGTLADKKKFEPLQTNKSYARNPNGAEAWSTQCFPTPGSPNCSNQLPPTPTRVFSLTSIAEARTLPDGARVSVLGSVVARPCELDTYGHGMTLSDGEAGIQIYLDFPSQLSCLIPRGEQIVVTGVLRDHFGLRTVYPESNQQITRHYAPPREIAPRHVHTGDLGDANESMPLMIEGAVSNGKNGDVIWVNDGTGMVEVYADPASGATFAGLTRGSMVRIYGIGYQNNQYRATDGGYYLRPRSPDDVIVLELAEKQPQAPGGRSAVDLGPVSIEQALNTRTQNYVTIGGVVTVPPGVVAERNFWIQDASGQGTRVFVNDSAGEIPMPLLNERVTVRGRVASAFGTREIRVELADGIQRYGMTDAVVPRALKTGMVGLSNEGALVAIQGFVAREAGREIYIDDGSGEVLVYIDATTRIRWPNLHIGDPTQIVGVVTRFRGEPEILPRFQSDVLFGVMLLPVAGEQNRYVPQMRARGRIGEALRVMREVRGHAAARVGDLTAERIRAHLKRTLAVRSKSTDQDLMELLAFVMLGASSVSGVIAVRKYRK